MAALTFVVLAHAKAHARGERVSAGPGHEYLVGLDGLLYQTGAIKSGGRVRYSKADLPGVHPDHVAALCKSPNIRPAVGYKGPVANGSAPAAPPAAAVGITKADYDKVVAERDRLVVENAKLAAVVADLRAQLPAAVKAAPPAEPLSPPVAPSVEPPAPPAQAPDAPPAAGGDNPPATDLPGILGVGVGKLGADVASGKHDAYLADLRAAEVAGKNRSSALGVIDARIKALAG